MNDDNINDNINFELITEQASLSIRGPGGRQIDFKVFRQIRRPAKYFTNKSWIFINTLNVLSQWSCYWFESINYK